MKYDITIISGCNYSQIRHYVISMALLYMCFQNLAGEQIKLSLKERKMSARTPSTFRLIGAGVTSVGALAAIFDAGGSNAQTLANLETDRTAYLETHCGHLYNDPPRHAGCYAEKSIEFSRARSAIMKDIAAAARKSADEHRKATAEHQKAITEHQKASAEHRKAGEAARTRTLCLGAISDAILGKRITPAEARAAKTTPTPSDDPCVWRERLAPRLGALTKQ